MGAAAAKVAVERFGDGLPIHSLATIKKRFGAHENAGNAVATLGRPFRHESLHQGMGGSLHKALDGLHRFALHRPKGEVAGGLGVTVHNHRAGAAHTVAAAKTGAFQSNIVAQDVKERGVVVRRHFQRGAVDGEGEGLGDGRPPCSMVVPRLMGSLQRWRPGAAKKWLRPYVLGQGP